MARRSAPGAAAPVPPMFAPFRLRELELANRVVVSPMAMYSCVDGMPNDFYLVHLGARAQGGAGLVFTEMTCVAPDARISPGCAGMYRDEHVAAWARIVDFVHGYTHGEDRAAARPCRAEGLDAARLGGARRAARRRQLAAARALADRVRRAQSDRRAR